MASKKVAPAAKSAKKAPTVAKKAPAKAQVVKAAGPRAAVSAKAKPAAKQGKPAAKVSKPAPEKGAAAKAPASKSPAKPNVAAKSSSKAAPAKKATSKKPVAANKSVPTKPTAVKTPSKKAPSAPAPAAKKAAPAPVAKKAPAAKAAAPASKAPAAKATPVAKSAAAKPAPAKQPEGKSTAAKEAAPAAKGTLAVSKPVPAPAPEKKASGKKASKKAPKIRVVMVEKAAPIQPEMPTNIINPHAIVREEKAATIIAHRRADNREENRNLTGQTMISYKPEFTRSLLDNPEEKSGPVYRYSDEELAEFRELIQGRLVSARKELGYLQGLITRKDEAGTEDTENRYMNMEDGSGAMEREQIAQLASRQIQFINHLEKALIRIENKTYGICRVTGKLIDKKRLRAVPHATLSIEAKQGMTK